MIVCPSGVRAGEERKNASEDWPVARVEISKAMAKNLVCMEILI
jgi:hypothetical protein